MTVHTVLVPNLRIIDEIETEASTIFNYGGINELQFAPIQH